MLKELKFVKGAVSKKDFLPALTHFRIENGTVRSFNGTLALSSPIALDINCTPKAEPFVKAIQNCKETVTLTMTANGRLSVKSGSFKAFIECVDTETAHVEPDGEQFEVNGEALLAALKMVQPFIGNDASRPWSNGVLLCGQSAFATNNVILVEYWIGSQFPFACNIPSVAVKEMIRINEPPIYARSTDKSISFHYEDGRWIHTCLYDLGWPDLNQVLDVSGDLQPINPLMFEALEVVKPFIDQMGRVFFTPGVIGTSTEENEGASYELPDFNYEGIFNHGMLSCLKGVAQQIDFSRYPAACPFTGDRLRGAIIGMRLT